MLASRARLRVVSAENVAIVRGLFTGGDGQSKEALLAVLPGAIPAIFDPEAEWIEAPERVDAKTYHGHEGIRRSFEQWLAQWGEYRIEAEALRGPRRPGLRRRPGIRPGKGERRRDRGDDLRRAHLPRLEGDPLPRVLRRGRGAGVDRLSRALSRSRAL